MTDTKPDDPFNRPTQPEDEWTDLNAEEAFVASLLLWKTETTEAAQQIQPADFHSLTCRTIYTEILRQHRQGVNADRATLADQLEAHIIDSLDRMTIEQPGGRWRNYAPSILEHARRRRLWAAGRSLTEQAMLADVDRLTSEMQQTLETASIGTTGPPVGLKGVDEFLDSPRPPDDGWVIPGLMRHGWRALIVGVEGSGKSWIQRSMAMGCANGLQPFNPGGPKYAPKNALIVDLENPEDALRDSLDQIRHAARQYADQYMPNVCQFWAEPSGINLRTPAHQSQLIAALDLVRPDLLCIGPVYKLYDALKGETDEQAARDCQRILDDLRTRYGFGLVLEHHAAKGAGGGFREMSPIGSSIWMRWPELGLKFIPADGEPEVGPTSFRFGRFKANDRVENEWPSHIGRDSNWPWRQVNGYDTPTPARVF